MADVADWGDHPVQRVVAAHEVFEPPEILDLDMPDPDMKLAASPPPTVPQVWKVTYSDGLFHRSEGASLVVAGSADAAVAIVAAADPFEGHPPYGVPAEYGPAERFSPEDPYVIWIEFDWIDGGEGDSIAR
jgi:hypothetical protein